MRYLDPETPAVIHTYMGVTHFRTRSLIVGIFQFSIYSIECMCGLKCEPPDLEMCLTGIYTPMWVKDASKIDGQHFHFVLLVQLNLTMVEFLNTRF